MMSTEDARDAIVALVEERPYTTGELSVVMGYPNGRVAQICKALVREKALWRDASLRWTTDATSVAPEEKPRIQGKRPHAALRQAHERPPKQTVNTADSLSWWATHPREGFSQTAQQQLARMRISREASTIPFRILQ